MKSVKKFKLSMTRRRKEFRVVKSGKNLENIRGDFGAGYNPKKNR